MRTHHRTTPRRLAAAAITLTALLGLAACGEEPIEPTPLETLSSSPTPTKPATPELPEAATKHTKAGAIAFVKHYVDVTNAYMATGDDSSWSPLVSAECESCSNLRKAIEKLYRGGGSIDGGELQIRKIALAPGGLTSVSGTVDVDGHYGPETITEGNKTRRNPGGDAFITYVLDRTSSGWSMSQYTQANTQ